MKRKTPTKVTFTFKNGTDHIQCRMIGAFIKRLAKYETRKARAAELKRVFPKRRRIVPNARNAAPDAEREGGE